MAYEKQNFADGQPLQARQLNHMEDGIADALVKVDGIESALDGILAIQNALIGGDGA